MPRRTVRVSVLAALLLSGIGLGCGQPDLFWTDTKSGTVHRLDRLGRHHLVVEGLFSPHSVAVDARASHLFAGSPARLGNAATFHVQRSDLDGSNIHPVCCDNNTHAIEGLAVDPERNRLFIAENGNAAPGTIWLVALDGIPAHDGQYPTRTALEIPETLRGDPRGLAVDPRDGRLFWADSEHGLIASLVLDASGQPEVDVFIADRVQPYGLAIDPVARHLYWTEQGPGHGRIRRCSLDDCDPDWVLETDTRPSAVQIDLPTAYVYWTEPDARDPKKRILRRDIEDHGEHAEPVPGLPTSDHRPVGLVLLRH
ncbi:MAG: hypothetical protein H6748_00800 [Spirochaetaceae bacterium]|nr:hypothetical protein [Spirochaetaceae bacterium]